jgi:hypothetical protein
VGLNSLLVWVAKPAGVLATSLALTLPIAAQAQEQNTTALIGEIADLLTFGNETTLVSIEQCTLRISTQTRTSCTYPSEPNWSETTIALNEVRDIEIRPHIDRYTVWVELDVPQPSIIWMMLTGQRGDDETNFEMFATESRRLLDESDIVSHTTSISCTGQEYPQKQRTIILFLDKVPESWDSFAAIVEECR